MAFFLFGRRKGKREEDKAVQKEKAKLTEREFNSPLLEAAFYHSSQFTKLANLNTEASRSCAYNEGTAAIRCYLQHLCAKVDGSIKGTRSIPLITKQANSKKKQVDAYLTSKLLTMNDSAELIYADIGIAKVSTETVENLREIIGKLELACS